MSKKYLILILLILVPFAYSVQEHDWLAQKFSSGSWSNNIQDTSLSLLALKDSTYQDEVDQGVTWLESKIESCINTNSCNVKDASYALIALDGLSSSSQIADDVQKWILNNSIFQYGGETSGWLAQVVSDDAGTCEISDPSNPSTKITMNINAGFTPFQPIPFISSTTSSIKVDCSSMTKAPTALSLMRQSGTTYYVNKEANNQKQAILELGYSCWGVSSSSVNCDPDSTAFALLALKKSGKLSDPKWLEDNKATSLQNAILYYITGKDVYLDKVIDDQNQFGYWGSANIYDTAIIYSIIPDSGAKTKAESWLASQEDPSGCWPKPATLCKIRSSAAVLFSGLQASGNLTEERIDQFENRTEGTIPSSSGDDCPEGFSCITEGGEDGTCDYWGQCIAGGEVGANGEDIAETCNEGDICTTGGCSGICDAFGDCVDDQTDNCISGPAADSSGSTTGREGSSALFWFLMVLLLLIILFGGGYLAYRKGWIKMDFFEKYMKGKKKEKAKSSFDTPFIPSRHPLLPASQKTTRRNSAESDVKGRISHDLDRSISEMERLLGGKKRK